MTVPMVVVMVVIRMVPIVIITPSVIPIRIPTPVAVIRIAPVRVPTPIIASPIGTISPAYIIAWIVIPIKWIITI